MIGSETPESLDLIETRPPLSVRKPTEQNTTTCHDQTFTPSDWIMIILKHAKNWYPISVCACIQTETERTHQRLPPWPSPKTPGVKVGNSLRWPWLFVSKYISKVSSFCGNREDGKLVRVKLELRLVGRCGCLRKTNAAWTFNYTLSHGFFPNVKIPLIRCLVQWTQRHISDRPV